VEAHPRGEKTDTDHPHRGNHEEQTQQAGYDSPGETATHGACDGHNERPQEDDVKHPGTLKGRAGLSVGGAS
jgi:hypothetical protein